jgi:hypothetical protein
MLWLGLFFLTFAPVTGQPAATGEIHGAIHASLTITGGRQVPVPLNGFALTVTQISGTPARPPVQLTTDVYGRFVVTGLPPGGYRINWQVAGWQPGPHPQTITIAQEPVHLLPILVTPVEPGKLLWGRVRYRETTAHYLQRSPWMSNPGLKLHQLITVTLYTTGGAPLGHPIPTNAWAEFVVPGARLQTSHTQAQFGAYPPVTSTYTGTTPLLLTTTVQNLVPEIAMQLQISSVNSPGPIDPEDPIIVVPSATLKIAALGRNPAANQLLAQGQGIVPAWQFGGSLAVPANGPKFWSLAQNNKWHRIDLALSGSAPVHDLIHKMVETHPKGYWDRYPEFPNSIPDTAEFLTRKQVDCRYGPNPCTISNDRLANLYYEMVDPLQRRTRLGEWWAMNGFDPQTGAGGVRLRYQNYNDLGFGRDMNCLQRGDTVACYVTNYGHPRAEAAENAELALIANSALAVGTVAMEYSRIEGSALLTPVVKFFAFGGGLPGDERINEVRLDDRDQDKFVPQLCLNCHGGRYTLGNPNLNASFMPFDAANLRFFEPCQPGSVHGCGLRPAVPNGPEQGPLKELNRMVSATHPSLAVQNLITGWYGVGLTRTTQDQTYIPPGWSKNMTDTRLYEQVISRSCRTCHINSVRNNFVLTATELNAQKAYTALCTSPRAMPHTFVTYAHFWSDPNQPARLISYLNDLIGANRPCG